MIAQCPDSEWATPTLLQVVNYPDPESDSNEEPATFTKSQIYREIFDKTRFTIMYRSDSTSTFVVVYVIFKSIDTESRREVAVHYGIHNINSILV